MTDRIKPGPKPGRPNGKAKIAAVQRKTKRRSKYNAKGDYVDGRWFDSQAEITRYRQLKELLEAGLIENLEFQLAFECRIENHPMFRYLSDFAYDVVDPTTGAVIESIIEDVKGLKTPVYRLKKKIIEAQHKIQIVEIPATVKELASWRGCTPYKERANQRHWLKRPLLTNGDPDAGT